MMSLKGVKKIGYLWWQQKKAGVPVTKQDGARPHTTATNPQHFARESAKYGFDHPVPP